MGVCILFQSSHFSKSRRMMTKVVTWGFIFVNFISFENNDLNKSILFMSSWNSMRWYLLMRHYLKKIMRIFPFFRIFVQKSTTKLLANISQRRNLFLICMSMIWWVSMPYLKALNFAKEGRYLAMFEELNFLCSILPHLYKYLSQ